MSLLEVSEELREWVWSEGAGLLLLRCLCSFLDLLSSLEVKLERSISLNLCLQTIYS